MRKVLMMFMLLFSFALQGQNYAADPLYKTADDWYEEHSPYSSLPEYNKPKGPRKAPVDTQDGRWRIGDDTDGWIYYITKNGRDYYRYNVTTGEWQYLLILGNMGWWIPVSAPNMSRLDYYAGGNASPIGKETILFLFCSIYIFKRWKRERKLCGERLHGEA